MMLSDRTISALLAVGELEVVPMPAPERIQPVSIDLTLGTSFCRPMEGGDHASIASRTVIRPGEFMLGMTHERVKMPRHIAGQVVGKSTWARRGLIVECAGLVDPGFNGTVTLELCNIGNRPLHLTAGDAICQIAFFLLDTAVARPYGSPGLNSHYQGQTKATPAAR